MSAAFMKRVKFKNGMGNDRPSRKAGHQPAIDRIFDHFQCALVIADQFGLCTGLVVGFLLLVSFVLQAAHSWAEKGVI